jgi:hypothetical protein
MRGPAGLVVAAPAFAAFVTSTPQTRSSPRGSPPMRTSKARTLGISPSKRSPRRIPLVCSKLAAVRASLPNGSCAS